MDVQGGGSDITSALNAAYNGLTDGIAAINGTNTNGLGINNIGVLGSNGSLGYGVGVAGYGYNPITYVTANGNNATDVGVYASSDQIRVWAYTNSTLLGLLFLAQNIGGGIALQIIDGTQAPGRVLTSDANGNATWQDPASGGGGGVTGPTGPAGPAGADGINGTNGTNGVTGPTGAAGTNGSNGTNGAKGANGTNGVTGPTTGAAGY